MPLILTLERQRQVDLSDFGASLVYQGSSRTVRTVTQRNPISKKNLYVYLAKEYEKVPLWIDTLNCSYSKHNRT